MKHWNTEQLKELARLSSFDITESVSEWYACRIVNLFRSCNYEDLASSNGDYILFLNHNHRCIGIEAINLYLNDNRGQEIQKILNRASEYEAFEIVIVKSQTYRMLEFTDYEIDFIMDCRQQLINIGIGLYDWINYDMKEKHYSFGAERERVEVEKRLSNLNVN